MVHSGRKIKRLRPQDYHSSSSEAEDEADEEVEDEQQEEQAVEQRGPNTVDGEHEEQDEETAKNTLLNTIPPSESDSDSTADEAPTSLAPDSSASDAESSTFSDASSTQNPSRRPKKRNDPSAFAHSLTTILGPPTTKRTARTGTPAKDPVLSRSATARSTIDQVKTSHLDGLARRKARQSKELLREKGHVRDVLLGTPASVTTVGGTTTSSAAGAGDKARGEEEVQEGRAAAIAEREARLKKTAQRGVVRLFNAVRQAQIRGEEAQRVARGGTGMGRKEGEEEVGRVSREGFLEMIASGGRKA